MFKLFFEKNKEYLFQLLILLFVLILTSWDSHSRDIRLREIVFNLNYFLIASIVNYYLIPRFYYKNRIRFWFYITAMVLLLVSTEEFVLEQIFYDSRARSFHLVDTIMEVVPTVFVFIAFKFMWDATVKQNKINQLQRMMAESQLGFLKSQINPHFLFNNLNNLYAHAVESSPKMPQMILELSNLLRYMLYEGNKERVSLSKEIESLDQFIHLQEHQMGKRGEILTSFKLEDSNAVIAPLILIVFVENAFKHSYSSQSENILIKIDVHVKNGRMQFFCENTYADSLKMEEVDGGIGLENVSNRLKLLYPDTHHLEITKKDGVFKVQLFVNLNKANHD